MMLEHAAEGELGKPYPFELQQTDGASVIDWRPAISYIVKEKDVRVVARRFHATLVEMILCRCPCSLATKGLCFQAVCFKTRCCSVLPEGHC